jgi:hypothetical protein
MRPAEGGHIKRGSVRGKGDKWRAGRGGTLLQSVEIRIRIPSNAVGEGSGGR